MVRSLLIPRKVLSASSAEVMARGNGSPEETEPMAARDMIAVIIALLALSGVAKAELHGSPERPPAFTAGEDRIIERNETLALVARNDPWLARQILDAIAALDATRALERASGDLTEAAPLSAQDAESDGVFDPDENPDLRRLERAAPEALHDLFQLLKTAGGASQPRAK
jgi:hypothetical protein